MGVYFIPAASKFSICGRGRVAILGPKTILKQIDRLDALALSASEGAWSDSDLFDEEEEEEDYSHHSDSWAAFLKRGTPWCCHHPAKSATQHTGNRYIRTFRLHMKCLSIFLCWSEIPEFLFGSYSASILLDNCSVAMISWPFLGTCRQKSDSPFDGAHVFFISRFIAGKLLSIPIQL